MRQFVDARGDAWPVACNGYTVKRCRDLLGIDIGEPSGGDPPLLSRLADIAFLVDLLYVVCKPKADELGLKDFEFAERLEGNVLQAARAQWMEVWADFFQTLGQPHKAVMLRKQELLVDAAIKTAEQAMSGEKFDAMVDRKVAELGESFANLLES